MIGKSILHYRTITKLGAGGGPMIAMAAVLWLWMPVMDLASRMREIAAAAEGQVGAAVIVVESGAQVAWQGDERFPMQSVYKFPIAMAVLHEVDAGRFSLEQSVRVEENDLVTPGQHSPIRDSHPKGGVTLSLRELLRLNVSESDGTACDVLLRLLGGPQWVQSYLRGLGVEDVRVETMEKTVGLDDTAQYRNWATPRAMAGLLRAFQNGRGLTAASQALLMEMMVQSPMHSYSLRQRHFHRPAPKRHRFRCRCAPLWTLYLAPGRSRGTK